MINTRVDLFLFWISAVWTSEVLSFFFFISFVTPPLSFDYLTLYFDFQSVSLSLSPCDISTRVYIYIVYSANYTGVFSFTHTHTHQKKKKYFYLRPEYYVQTRKSFHPERGNDPSKQKQNAARARARTVLLSPKSRWLVVDFVSFK